MVRACSPSNSEVEGSPEPKKVKAAVSRHCATALQPRSETLPPSPHPFPQKRKEHVKKKRVHIKY